MIDIVTYGGGIQSTTIAALIVAGWPGGRGRRGNATSLSPAA